MASKIEQVLVGLTERHKEMIAEIMKAKGYPTRASVIQQAIIDLHGNVFKDYVMAKKARTLGTEEGRTKSEIKKSVQTDKLENVCQVLGGEIIDRKGVAYCDYYTFERKNRYKQEVPLADIDESFVEKQYFPSKAAVKKLQKEKKVSY